MSATVTGPRVRHRWRIELNAADVQAAESTHLRRAMERQTTGMTAGLDVIVVVRGPVGANVGAGTTVGQHLHDARTIDVLACGSYARYFVEELKRAAAEQCDPDGASLSGFEWSL